jgi:hypothetical protein
MGIKKRIIAAVMVGVLTLSSAFTVSAATNGSPIVGKDTEDDNHVDHMKNKVVYSKVNSTTNPAKAIVYKVTSTKTSKHKAAVDINYARSENNKKSSAKIPVTQLGDGKKGVFNSKKGRIIKRVYVKSQAKNGITIAKKAFYGSKVNKITFTAKKVKIKASAFSGTKVENLKIVIKGKKKTAKAFSFAKGAFKGLSSDAKVIVSKKTMSKKQYKKLVKKLRKAGFEGTIKRK